MEKTTVTTSSTPKQFEIQLFDEVIDDKTGQIQYRRVQYDQPIIIEASNKKELDEHAARFRICNQVMKIVREIPSNPTPTNCNSNVTLQTSTPPQNNSASISTSTISNNSEITCKTQPKYYSISGIDIKDDNGKIYQKQWVRLSDKDAENFRIVNDSNNKLVALSGKHLEMKRWILVENIQDTENTLEGDLINE